MTELPFTHIIPGMASSELVLAEGGTFMMAVMNTTRKNPSIR